MRSARTLAALGVVAFALSSLPRSVRLDGPSKRFDKPSEAQQFFARKRAPVGQRSVPSERYAAARRKMARMPVYSTAAHGRIFAPLNAYLGPSWTDLGPGNIGGRTRALVIDPVTPTTMYAGGVAGGVFKSTDGGASWSAKGDAMANLAVATLGLDPGNNNNLLAGTGEGYFNLDAVRGDGIFRSTDAGGTWAQIASTANNPAFSYVNKIVFSPLNTNYVYAATSNRDDSLGGAVWRSSDGGLTWTQILTDPTVGQPLRGCLDLAIRDDDANDWLVASCGTFNQAYLYTNQSARTGSTWTNFTDPSWNTNQPPTMGRTSLALAPSNPLVIYALSAGLRGGNFQDGFYKLFKTTDAGQNWSTVYNNQNPVDLKDLLLTNPLFAAFATCDPAQTNAYYNQGWYDNVIAVDPTDPNSIWVGGIDLFRSTDAGGTWGLASYWWDPAVPSYVHADQHVLAFHPGYDGTTNKTLYVANDGGIFATADATAAAAYGTPALRGLDATCDPANSSVVFTSLNNGFGVTQFYYGAVYPSNDTYFGGTQDNGTVLGTEALGPNGWLTINAGDGGAVAVDRTNTNVLYSENTALSIQKCTLGTACTPSDWAGAVTGISDTGFLFIAPLVMDPSSSQRLWTGGFSLWRTSNGASSWAKASTSIGSLTNIISISAIAVARSNPNAVLAGAQNGNLYSTTKGLTATGSTLWTLAQPPGTQGAYVSSVAFDPSDPTIAYATYSNFGTTHVWKSLDGGVTWTALAFPLDIPVHSVVVDPTDTQRLYVGTDLGVFVSPDTGANWYVENTGFANVITEQLVVNGPHLYAFTHGRGAFRVGLTSAAQTVSVEIAVDSSTVSEGAGTASIPLTVRTSDGLITAAPLVVSYATKDGTAKAGSDYAQGATSFTIPAGTADGSTANMPITILEDVVKEVNETFTVTLTGLSGGVLGGRRAHTVTIQDDNATSFQFKLPVQSISEAATQVVVTVIRGENLTTSASVDYATSDGTAAASADYMNTTGTLNFGAGVASRTFAVKLLPDLTYEGDEQFMLRLKSPSPGSSLGTPSVAVINIVENDAAAILQLSASKYTVLESAGTAVVTVKRSGVTTSTATVDYTTSDGTATVAGSDYTAASGTLTFGPGVVTQTVGIAVNDDTVAEGAESFTVKLGNNGPGSKLGTIRSATVAITDNDQAVQWSLPTYAVSEAATQAILTVRRTGGTAGTVNVDYAVTAGGTATGGGVDYSFTPGTLTFLPGVASRTIPVPFVNDTLHEGEETVNITLSNPSPGLTILGPATTVLKIMDNEPTVQFTSSKYTVPESSTKATITVKRTVDLTSTVTVDYSLSPGTAIYGGDYAGSTTGSVTMGPSIASKTFSVSLKPDTLDEPNETILLTLTGVSPGLPVGFGLGTPQAAVVSVTDNDVAGIVQFASTTYSAGENTGVATITVKRASGIASGASVQYTAAVGGSVPASGTTDFTPTTGTLSFGAGELAKTFTVPILDDGVPEAGKTVLLTLSNPSYGVKLGTVVSAVLWIVDDD